MPEETALIPIQTQDIIKNAVAWCKSISEIRITDQPTLINAVDLTKRVKEQWKDLDGARKFIVQPYNDKVKEINAIFKEPLSALESLEIKLRNAMGKYNEDQRKLQEEQRKHDEELIREEKEKLRKTAAETKDPELARIAESIQPSTPSMPPPKIEGLHFRKYYYAEMVDKKKFAEWCIANNEMQYWTVNMTELNAFASATKSEANVPGIVFKTEDRPALR